MDKRTNNTMTKKKWTKGQTIQWLEKMDKRTNNAMTKRKWTKGQTIQWLRENGQKDKQWSRNTTRKSKDWTTWIPLISQVNSCAPEGWATLGAQSILPFYSKDPFEYIFCYCALFVSQIWFQIVITEIHNRMTYKM